MSQHDEPRGELLAALEKLAKKFNSKARYEARFHCESAADYDRGIANTLQAAVQALRDEQDKNLALQRELDTLKNPAPAKGPVDTTQVWDPMMQMRPRKPHW